MEIWHLLKKYSSKFFVPEDSINDKLEERIGEKRIRTIYEYDYFPSHIPYEGKRIKSMVYLNMEFYTTRDDMIAVVYLARGNEEGMDFWGIAAIDRIGNIYIERGSQEWDKFSDVIIPQLKRYLKEV